MRRLLLVSALLFSAAAPAIADNGYAELETLVAGEAGSVVLAYDIAPSGDVENCVVEQSTGFPRLDAASCQMMVRKARFEPVAARTRVKRTIRWLASAAPTPAAGQPAPQPIGEGTPADWASLNPGWTKAKGSN